ncbi:MAG: ABC transporter permease [Sphingobacteriaceae bacterium]|nr:ABC transporter permease [Cytophagaceae bacterium]
MFSNYLKIAWRNVTKHKVYSFINLSGLTVAVACCLLIGLFVRHEWSYDRFHAKSDRLYRAWTQELYNGEVFINTSTPYPLGPTLHETLPEVEGFCRIEATNANVRRGAEVFNERVHLADSTFFHLFDFPLRSGAASQALRGMNTVVLSEEMAEKYFGTQNPVGRTIQMDLDSVLRPFTVTAVAKNTPVHSSIRFGMMVSMEHVKAVRSDRAMKSWFNVTPETYVLLRNGADTTKLNAKFPGLLRTALGGEYTGGNYAIHLQPIADIHLDTVLTGGLEPVSNPAYSYILMGIALFVLVIACINFVTLTLGRSVSRAQEVGVRKAMGALRGQLINQFWGEALVMTAIAVGLGLGLAFLLMPLFNQLTNKDLTLRPNGELLALLLGLVVAVGLVAGSYPALVLSAFRPVEVLKGKLTLQGDTNWFRRALVVVQFSLAVLLIAGTLVLNRQLAFLKNTSLGFQPAQTVVVALNKGGDEGRQLAGRLRDALVNRPGVLGVTASAFPFGAVGNWGQLGYTDNKRVYRELRFNLVDPYFLPTHGIRLVAGRNFDPRNSADVFGGIIVNQAFVKEYGWKDPLNARLPGTFNDHRIIGVTDDFHYTTLRSKVEPLMLMIRRDSLRGGFENINYDSSPLPDLSVRLAADNLTERVAMLERVWKSVAPNEPFSYSFLDQNLQRQYEQEQRLGHLVGIGSVLSILIASLGLFGLATLAVARRTKEIGIRKVLGASVLGLVGLLSKDFLKLVLLGILIATPLAWYATNSWLNDFAYRIPTPWWAFALAGVLAVGIALLTVSFQSVKAALMNPAKSLRSE